MNEFEISLDIMEQESSGEDVNWRLQTKVDADSHDAVIEFANKFTRGNISAAVRYMVRHHVQEHGGVYTSPIQQAWLKLKQQQRKASSRLEKIRTVHQAAIELRKHPDAEYESAAGVLAESLGIVWPIPENELPAESLVNPTLRYVIDHLGALWADNGDSTTFRDLQRKTKRKAEQLKGALDILVDEGKIKLKYKERGSIVILPERTYETT